jgi:hypothetical protein
VSYYLRRADGTFLPTEHAGGAWNPGEVHFAPLSALIAHEIDRHRTGIPLARISFDILGFLGAGPCEIRVETVRPGRTIELVEAVASIDGRPVVRARAWFLAEFDSSSVAGGAPATLPHPDTLEPAPMMTERWTGGFVRSLDVRVVSAPAPGRATVWLGSDHDILDGEALSGHATFLRLVDTANGIAVRQRPTDWLFPNVDLTVHLYREPVGRWVGLDTTVTFGASGHGLTSTVLHDVEGPVGVAQQALTVRPV